MSADLPRGTVVLAVVGACALSVLGWAIGLEWPQAILVGLSAVVVLGLRRLPTTNDEEGWPVRDDSDDRGVRRDVARLSWTLQGYQARVERPSLRRLRAVAANRLAAVGLDLDNPADDERCRAALGPIAYGVVQADPRTDVQLQAFAKALATVEQLGDTSDTRRAAPVGKQQRP